jgi:hypothetical protein
VSDLHIVIRVFGKPTSLHKSLARRIIMSKRINRFALAVLISLAVVAGVYTSVLGASLRHGTVYGSVHLTAGLLPDLKHQRSINSVNEYFSDFQAPAHLHGCDGDSGINPDD